MSIAYITDAQMLKKTRVERCPTLNFWRLSTNTNFSDFAVGDLLFFLSKDREYRKKGEKGIIGFGRCAGFTVASPQHMCRRYKEENGYSNKEEFFSALKRSHKDHLLPERISSIYLQDVLFLQMPIYLSECGMEISPRTESYIYLDKDVPLKILHYAKDRLDFWSSRENASEVIEKEIRRYTLREAAESVGDLPLPANELQILQRRARSYQKQHPDYLFLDPQHTILCSVDRKTEILFPKDRRIDRRFWLGQRALYQEKLDFEPEYRLYDKECEDL